MFEVEQADLVLGRPVFPFGRRVLEAGEAIGQGSAAVHVQVVDRARLCTKAARLARDDHVAILEPEVPAMKQPLEGSIGIRLRRCPLRISAVWCHTKVSHCNAAEVNAIPNLAAGQDFSPRTVPQTHT